MNKRAVLFLICCCCILSAAGQGLTNLRQKYISTRADSVFIDTLSIIPNSLFISVNNELIDTSAFSLNSEKAVLFWKKKSSEFLKINVDSVKITYRSFPILFTKNYFNKDALKIEKRFEENFNPYEYEPDKQGDGIFKMDNLSHQGSISRGISFGNNQDAVVTSSMNLQLAGRLNKTWEIAAAITDNNIPVQPEGNTQQLQEFDKVFIQISNQNTKILAGDYDLTRPKSYFMNYLKKAQGLLISSSYPVGEKNKINMRTTGSASISKGKFAQNVINGIESNQGPYRLLGAENETYIIVLSGSEKVFINGLLMLRGQEFDYTIDYNTAEITFTANRIITKDSRITVEFQYSDKNYIRTLFYVNHEMDFAKAKVRLNVYSEQDAKNQPLQQDLNDSAKLVLSEVGDSLNLAVVDNIDSIVFNTNEVLYAKRDTIVNSILYNDILVYSTAPDSAHYRAGFSFVGANAGNYAIIVSAANGKVYQWIAPVNGVLQGSYEPVVQLISPKKKQMVTLGADYAITDKTMLTVEGAMSNNDVNLFSSKDKKNDVGYGITALLRNATKLQHDTVKPWMLLSEVGFEYVYKYFSPIETYRPIEFNRDWNLNSLPPTSQSSNEYNGSFKIALAKANEQNVQYQFKTFVRQEVYNGYMNSLNTNLNYKKFKLLVDGSYLLSTSATNSTDFLRLKSDLSKSVSIFAMGLTQELEHNKIKFKPADSLSIQSFRYDQFGAYFCTNEKAEKTKFRFDYFRRFDYGIRINDFNESAFTDNITGNVDLQTGKNSRLSLGAAYRNLVVKDSTLSTNAPQTTFLGKINYNLLLLKGGINFNTYYEAGSGQELKQEYAYVEVSPGTGVYTWTDYNQNGVKEINEFDVAAFVDQANYIKVFTLSTQYIRTLSNQWTALLNLNPSAFADKDKKFQSILSKFANQTAIRFDNKTIDSDILKALNPVTTNPLDTSLVTTNSSVRNTFFYNRNSNQFGADITYQNLRNKQLLSTGFQLVSLQSTGLNIRWNLNRVFGLQALLENGKKENRAEFFINRNYLLKYYKTQPQINIQPNSQVRISFLYLYNNKKNILGETGEQAIQNNISGELRFSSLKKGVATARINFIQLNYNADVNTPLAYDMLEGLQKGKNITWNLNLQRNLSKVLQLSVNYEGRKSKDVKTVHTAGVQARAFF